MQDRLVSFIQVLRSHDVRISPAETLDAMEVAALLGYADPRRLEDGLGAALAKTAEEQAIFRRCFERFFHQQLTDFAVSPGERHGDDAPGPAAAVAQDSGGASGGQAALQAAAQSSPGLGALLQSPLMQGLLENDSARLSLELTRAAGAAGLPQIRMFTQKGQYTRKILQQMGEAQFREAVLELERAGDPALPVLLRYRDSLRERVRDHVEQEYLLHAEGHNRRFLEQILAETRLNNIDAAHMQRVRELVRRMARRLAARHAHRRRRSRRGQLNAAQTLRRGVATDGVLFNTVWRRRRRDRPQVLAVCDVSGSVAAYARFLLLFLYSVQEVLPRVRSFAFSSHLGEVSQLFRELPVEVAIEATNRRYGGATDYGTSLTDFKKLVFDDVDSATTVLILGDARNNHGDARLDVLQGIYRRAHRVIWLNPESRRAWGTGDSEMLRYQTACHVTAECNNLKQLDRIIDQLIKSSR